MDYKDTLILPNTDFPMRGNLPQNEPATYKKWRDEKIFNKIKTSNPSTKNGVSNAFTLHDGPPYANGNIHIGHALNKILKDIIVKLHYFNGQSVRYTPGWDCHGLPIEQKVEEKITKAKKESLPKTQFRQLCRNWAADFIAIQSQEFQNLGVLGDFENAYKTMDFAFEAQIYKALCEIAKQGLLKQRLKPIFWSWAAKSALAEAEVEYKDKEDYSLFVAFDLDSQSCAKLGVEKARAVIWTTTPWTLPSNQAIALNANEKYVLTNDDFIFALELLESAVNAGITKGGVKKEFIGSDFENLIAINPLNGRQSRLILGDHVLMTNGSGLVHSAPGFGEDDYFVCLKYDIEVIMPVDDGGCFDERIKHFGLFKPDVIDEFVGRHVFSSNERIIELLGDCVLSAGKFTHSYPYCWRTHKPIIYRATTQWFILMDEPFFNGKTLREIALEQIEKTIFYPEAGKNRIKTMIQTRPDWCISRQRDWGVPIAFFIDKRSGEAVLDSEVLDFVANIFEKEGCDAWWERETADLLPDSFKAQAQHFEKGSDILDVWFDSGSTWSAVLDSQKYDAGNAPAHIYLEGSDQHRGWFQSSLLVSCAIKKIAPFKAVITHGFTMDENGQKMSKSLGNTIAPQEILKNYGSEILRLWVAQSDYQNDQRISQNILKQNAENYKKIRNTIRFLLANTQGLQNLGSIDSEIDLYFLHLAQRELECAHELFCKYEFSHGLSVISNFVSAALSGIYMDLCKDSLYCDSATSSARLGTQSVMALILRKLLWVLAPFFTYTIDEAFKYLSDDMKRILGADDVFELRNANIVQIGLNLDESKAKAQFENLQGNFAVLLQIREKFAENLDRLKKDGAVKSSLELVIISPSDWEFAELDKWLIVSDVVSQSRLSGADFVGEVLAEFEIQSSDSQTAQIFKIARTKKHKCPRCWRYLGLDSESLCPRCEEVLR